jgi:hypothetical protein
MAEGVEW